MHCWCPVHSIDYNVPGCMSWELLQRLQVTCTALQVPTACVFVLLTQMHGTSLGHHVGADAASVVSSRAKRILQRRLCWVCQVCGLTARASLSGAKRCCHGCRSDTRITPERQGMLMWAWQFPAESLKLCI